MDTVVMDITLMILQDPMDITLIKGLLAAK